MLREKNRHMAVTCGLTITYRLGLNLNGVQQTHVCYLQANRHVHFQGKQSDPCRAIRRHNGVTCSLTPSPPVGNPTPRRQSGTCSLPLGHGQIQLSLRTVSDPGTLLKFPEDLYFSSVSLSHTLSVLSTYRKISQPGRLGLF